MDVAFVIPAVLVGGVIFFMLTLWASFRPSTTPLSVIIQALEGKLDVSPKSTPRKKLSSRKKEEDSKFDKNGNTTTNPVSYMFICQLLPNI